MTKSLRPYSIKYPFAYIGAGEAEYFEWAQLHLRFVHSPTLKQRKKIASIVPKPLADSIRFSQCYLALASEQGVGRLIESTYGKIIKSPTRLTTTCRFKQAKISKTMLFNADMERFLKEAHAIVPILIAYRPSDGEAGGTVYSKWHTWSMKELPAILKKIKGTKNKNEINMIKSLQSQAQPEDRQSDMEKIDKFNRWFPCLAPKEKRMLSQIREVMNSFDKINLWWLAADSIADYLNCFRDEPQTQKLLIDPALAIALEVFSKALSGNKASDHVRGFQSVLDSDMPAWHLPQLMAIGIEIALRAGDEMVIAHFIKGLDVKLPQQRDYIMQSVEVLKKEGLIKLAQRMEKLVI